MRKFLLGLTVAFIFAQTSWGACGDTTVLLNGTNPAFNTGTMTFNPATLNTAIDQCGDSTMTITLENAAGNSSDTVKFSNELVVTSRPSGAVTHLVGKGRDVPPDVRVPGLHAGHQRLPGSRRVHGRVVAGRDPGTRAQLLHRFRLYSTHS